LAEATEDLMAGALQTAWKLRMEKNAKTGKTGKKQRARSRKR
jgi:hypothetical protein